MGQYLGLGFRKALPLSSVRVPQRRSTLYETILTSPLVQQEQLGNLVRVNDTYTIQPYPLPIRGPVYYDPKTGTISHTPPWYMPTVPPFPAGSWATPPWQPPVGIPVADQPPPRGPGANLVPPAAAEPSLTEKARGWLDQEMFSGVPNKWLVLAAIFFWASRSQNVPVER